MKHVIAALLLALALAGCASQGAPEGTAPLPSEGADATGTETPGTDEPDNDADGSDVPADPAPDTTAAKVSAAELALHDNESDCWVLYDGDVYDVTAFLPNHPGGAEAIAPYCGLVDDSFATAFEGQHGTEKVGVLENESALKGTLEG
ncbi:MAG: cytochrome b5 domain-containing protein [Candidatus Micrarchaeota archaeon]